MRWDDASQVCQQEGGHLVSIGSKNEERFISANLDKDKEWWTAGSRTSENNWIWENGNGGSL